MLVILFSICLFIVTDARPKDEALKQLPEKDILDKLGLSKLTNIDGKLPLDLPTTPAHTWTEDSLKNFRSSFTKADIDKKEIDDLNVELLLEGTTVGHDGAYFKPFGLRPEQTPRAVAEAYRVSSEMELRKSNRQKRSFIPRFHKFDHYWPNNTVLYFIYGDSFSNLEEVRSLIRDTMDDIEKKTCVKFVEINFAEALEMTRRDDYSLIQILQNGPGCYTYVGRYGVRTQFTEKIHNLNLQQPQCMKKSTIKHELGHVLGMEHELMRSDRDEHIRVRYDHIRPGYGLNFEKKETINRTPFDYASLLQYPLNGFSKSYQEQTLEVRDPELEYLMDKYDDLSYYDVMAINKAYKCDADCDLENCEYGAIRDKNCKCLCPEGLEGPTCNKVVGSAICGGIVDIIPGTETELISTEVKYLPHDGAKCYWLLQAPKEYSITIKIDKLNMQWNKETNRCYHWLEIKYNLIGQPAPKYCGDSFPRGKISTTKYGETNLMMLKWDTSTVSGVPIKEGFKLRANAYRAYGIQSKGCPKPPEIKNAISNYKDVGRKNGAIVIYKCKYPYTMFGDATSVTCQADNTWSNPAFKCLLKDPTFACDFETSNCHILQPNKTYQWRRTVIDGEAFLRFNQAAQYSGGVFSHFALLNPLVKPYRQYCLSLSLRRPFGQSSCTSYYINISTVSSLDFVSYLMISSNCNVPDWVTYKATFSANEPVYIAIITISKSGSLFNLDLDNIVVREGRC